MYYIEYDKKFNVTYIHYMPFDSQYGLGKTEEELKLEGALVEKFEIQDGHVARYDQDTNKVISLKIEEKFTTEQRLNDLEDALVEVANIIGG